MRKLSHIRTNSSLFIALGFAALVTAPAWSAGLQSFQITGELTIGGTGAALGTMQKLADAFSKNHPEVRVKILPSLGSGGGIKALMADKLTLSVSARPITDAERTKGLISKKIAKSPFVFATGLRTPVVNLTLEQLAALYSGKITTWSDGTQVRLVLRPAEDVDTQIVKDMSAALGQAIQIAHQREGKNIAITDTDSADDLERIPGAIGSSTLALIKSEDRRLKILSVDGVSPSIRNLANSKYPYQKSVYLVTGSSPSAVSQEFIKFVDSDAGATILTETGNLPAASAK